MRRHDSQYNEIQLNDTEHHWKQHKENYTQRQVPICYAMHRYYNERRIAQDKSNLFLILNSKHTKNNNSIDYIDD
jgi:hypothetical protein